jgi:hypothetical protein
LPVFPIEVQYSILKLGNIEGTMEIITVNGKPVFRSSTQSFYDNQFSQKVLASGIFEGMSGK